MRMNWKRLGVVTAVLALAGLLVFNSAALAQGPVEKAPAPPAAWGDPANPGFGARAGRWAHARQGFNIRMMGRWGGLEDSPMAIAAKVLGMDQADLVAELRSGKSLADIAGDKLDDIVKAIAEDRQEHSLVGVTARVLDMSIDDVRAQLREGKSIADIAGDKLDDIIDALLAPREERLNQLVQDGKLTEEQKDALLSLQKARLEERLSQPFTPRFVDANGDGYCDLHEQPRQLRRSLGRMGGIGGRGGFSGRWHR
ncbi:MAG: hypothetical protein J7M34_03880 [Anaerolineae bacterium]|nr:hypothetical protein [Anaerolineae bacterium]